MKVTKSKWPEGVLSQVRYAVLYDAVEALAVGETVKVDFTSRAEMTRIKAALYQRREHHHPHLRFEMAAVYFHDTEAGDLYIRRMADKE